MRISVVEKDPGYSPIAHHAVDKVTLNGELVEHCLTADEEKGYVLFYEVDENDNVCTEGDTVITGELIGDVKIFLKKDFNPLMLTGWQ